MLQYEFWYIPKNISLYWNKIKYLIIKEMNGKYGLHEQG